MKNVNQLLKAVGTTVLLAMTIQANAADGIKTLPNGDTVITINANDSSEVLTNKAEKLLTPNGFMYAYDVLNQALRSDSQNKKARIYANALYPLMLSKGILKRIRPIFQRVSQKAVNNYQSEIANIPQSSLKRFLLNGSEDITTAERVQAYLNQVKVAQDAFYQFIKTNKNIDVEVSPTVVNDGANFRTLLSVCEVQKRSENEYLVKKCPFTSVKTAKLGPADMEVIRHMAAGQKISSILTTAYNLRGGVQVAALIDQINPNDHELISDVKTRQEFGKLKGDNNLAELVQMGADLVDGFDWIKGLERDLCPSHKYRNNQRPGMAFDKGLCANDRTDATTRSIRSVVNTVEQMLAGPAFIDYYRKRDGSKERTLVAGREFLENPAQDLKAILPATDKAQNFDRCGNATQVADTTLGGLLPNKDGNKVLTDLGVINRPCY